MSNYNTDKCFDRYIAELEAEVLGLGQEIDEYRCRVEIDAARIKQLEAEILRLTTEKG